MGAERAAAQEQAPTTPPPTPRTAAPPPEEDLPPPSAPENHLIGGAAMTVGWYGVGVGTSFLWSDAPGAEELRIPVAGPWMSLAETGCPKDDPDCSIVIVILQAVLTTLSGVGQVGGLAVMGEALFVPTREPRTASQTREVAAQVQPLVSSDRIGLGVAGTF